MSVSRSSENESSICPDFTLENITMRRGKRIDKSMDEILDKYNSNIMSKLDAWRNDLDINFTRLHGDMTNIKTELTDLKNVNTELKLELNSLRSDYTKMKLSINRIEVCNNEVCKDITNLQNSVQFASEQYDEIKNRLTSVNMELESTKKTSTYVLELQTQVQILQGELNSQQQRDRIFNVEIVGVPETKNENLTEIILKLADRVNVKITASDIEHINRIQSRQPIPGRPRVVICKFRNRLHKDSIIAGARKLRGLMTSDINLPGQEKIYVNEHLTMYNKGLYKKCRDLAKIKQYNFVWIKNCRIYIRKNDISKHFFIDSEKDLAKIV